MEILQKTSYFIFHMAMVTLPNSPAPAAHSQSPRPNYWGLVQNAHNAAPTWLFQALLDPGISNLGGFGPKHTLYCSWNEPIFLLPSALWPHPAYSQMQSSQYFQGNIPYSKPLVAIFCGLEQTYLAYNNSEVSPMFTTI